MYRHIVGSHPPRPLKWYPLGWYSVHKYRYVTWQVDDFGKVFVVHRSTLLHFINYT